MKNDVTLSAELERDRILTSAEAARFINFSLAHVRRLYRSGGMPKPLRLSGRKIGWKRSTLQDWIDIKAKEAY